MSSSVSSPLDAKHAFLEPPSLVPAKRKRSNTSSNHARIENSPAAQPQPTQIDSAAASQNVDSIYCICGYTHDDGFSIACDNCERWSHAVCFDITPGNVPQNWNCWQCNPRAVDRDRAIKLQKTKLESGLNTQAPPTNGGAGPPTPAQQQATSQTSTVKRRGRRSSITNMPNTQPAPSVASQKAPGEDDHIDIEDEMKKSYVHIVEDNIPQKSTRDIMRAYAQNWRGVTALSPSEEDMLLQMRRETPAAAKVVHIPGDPGDVSAKVRPATFALQTTRPIPETAYIMPYTSTVIPSAAYLADPLNSYAHMGLPMPFVHLVPPPLSVALDARLVGNEARFARSGCRPNAVLRPVLCHKKRKVLHPNPKHNRKSYMVSMTSPTRPKHIQHDTSVSPGVNGVTVLNGLPTDAHTDSDSPPQAYSLADSETDGDDEVESLGFAIFALRDLKAYEEVVLGWEWDDGSVVHQLPALVKAGGVDAFDGGINGAGPSTLTALHKQMLRLQMRNIIHSIDSRFVSCACGDRASNCAIRYMKSFVDGDFPSKDTLHSPLSTPSSRPPTPPLPTSSSTDADSIDTVGTSPPNKHPSSLSTLREIARRHPIDLGPLIGSKRGLRTRVVGGTLAAGIKGVEMVDEDGEPVPSGSGSSTTETLKPGTRRGLVVPEVRVQKPTPRQRGGDRKGKGRADEVDLEGDMSAYNYLHANGRMSPQSPSPGQWNRPSISPEPSHSREDVMPPKMRKKWIRQERDALKKIYGDVGGKDETGGTSAVDHSAGGRDSADIPSGPVSDICVDQTTSADPVKPDGTLGDRCEEKNATTEPLKKSRIEAVLDGDSHVEVRRDVTTYSGEQISSQLSQVKDEEPKLKDTDDLGPTQSTPIPRSPALQHVHVPVVDSIPVERAPTWVQPSFRPTHIMQLCNPVSPPRVSPVLPSRASTPFIREPRIVKTIVVETAGDCIEADLDGVTHEIRDISMEDATTKTSISETERQDLPAGPLRMDVDVTNEVNDAADTSSVVSQRSISPGVDSPPKPFTTSPTHSPAAPLPILLLNSDMTESAKDEILTEGASRSDLLEGSVNAPALSHALPTIAAASETDICSFNESLAVLPSDTQVHDAPGDEIENVEATSVVETPLLKLIIPAQPSNRAPVTTENAHERDDHEQFMDESRYKSPTRLLTPVVQHRPLSETSSPALPLTTALSLTLHPDTSAASPAISVASLADIQASPASTPVEVKPQKVKRLTMADYMKAKRKREEQQKQRENVEVTAKSHESPIVPSATLGSDTALSIVDEKGQKDDIVAPPQIPADTIDSNGMSDEKKTDKRAPTIEHTHLAMASSMTSRDVKKEVIDGGELFLHSETAVQTKSPSILPQEIQITSPTREDRARTPPLLHPASLTYDSPVRSDVVEHPQRARSVSSPSHGFHSPRTPASTYETQWYQTPSPPPQKRDDVDKQEQQGEHNRAGSPTPERERDREGPTTNNPLPLVARIDRSVHSPSSSKSALPTVSEPSKHGEEDGEITSVHSTPAPPSPLQPQRPYKQPLPVPKPALPPKQPRLFESSPRAVSPVRPRSPSRGSTYHRRDSSGTTTSGSGSGSVAPARSDTRPPTAPRALIQSMRRQQVPMNRGGTQLSARGTLLDRERGGERVDRDHRGHDRDHRDMGRDRHNSNARSNSRGRIRTRR